MSFNKKNIFLIENKKSRFVPQKGNKFELVNCSLDGFYCKKDILPEINKLYEQSDTYRVNREFQKSIDLLNQAYQKTLELKDISCAKCVGFFQNNITETLELIQKELSEMSQGVFSKNRYQFAFSKLGGILHKMNQYKDSKASI